MMWFVHFPVPACALLSTTGLGSTEELICIIEDHMDLLSILLLIIYALLSESLVCCFLLALGTVYSSSGKQTQGTGSLRTWTTVFIYWYPHTSVSCHVLDKHQSEPSKISESGPLPSSSVKDPCLLLCLRTIWGKGRIISWKLSSDLHTLLYYTK